MADQNVTVLVLEKDVAMLAAAGIVPAALAASSMQAACDRIRRERNEALSRDLAPVLEDDAAFKTLAEDALQRHRQGRA